MLTKRICSEYGEYIFQCNGIEPDYIATLQTASLREFQENGKRHPLVICIISKTCGSLGCLENPGGPSCVLSK